MPNLVLYNIFIFRSFYCISIAYKNIGFDLEFCCYGLFGVEHVCAWFKIKAHMNPLIFNYVVLF